MYCLQPSERNTLSSVYLLSPRMPGPRCVRRHPGAVILIELDDDADPPVGETQRVPGVSQAGVRVPAHFVHLPLPLLFNLRRDPFEKSQHNSNTYHDWMIDRAFVLVPLQAVASKFLMTLKDFPPSQKPGDWSLGSLEKQIKGMTTAGE